MDTTHPRSLPPPSHLSFFIHTPSRVVICFSFCSFCACKQSADLMLLGAVAMVTPQVQLMPFFRHFSPLDGYPSPSSVFRSAKAGLCWVLNCLKHSLPGVFENLQAIVIDEQSNKFEQLCIWLSSIIHPLLLKLLVKCSNAWFRRSVYEKSLWQGVTLETSESLQIATAWQRDKFLSRANAPNVSSRISVLRKANKLINSVG